MVFERTEHEPDEYDPEEDLRDPETDSITIPEIDSVTVPEVTTTETDVPGELLAAFWTIVLTVNAAVLAVSVGAMVLFFWGDGVLGGGLLVGGAILFALAARRYRAFEASSGEPSGNSDGSNGDPDASDGDDQTTGPAPAPAETVSEDDANIQSTDQRNES